MINYYRSIGATEAADPSYMVKMAATFASAPDEMMSIILNREFYGGFIALILPMAIGSFLLTRNHVWQVVCTITVALGGICLFLTQSKGCWAAGAMGIAFFVFLYLFVSRLEFKYRKQILTLVAGGAVVVGALVLLTSGSVGQVKSLGLSFSSRAIIWGGAINIWKEFPILGGAPGGFRMFFPEQRRPDYFLYDISHVTISAHNYFLDFLCDTGILGFLAFMFFLGVIYWKFLRRARKDALKENRIVAISMISGLTGFMLSSMTSPCARWAVGAAFLWSAYGMMASVVQRRIVFDAGQTSPQVDPRNPGLRFHLPTPVIWGLVVASVCIAIYSATFGVNFFRSAMYNNVGVSEMGDESHPGPLMQAQRLLNEKREALNNQSLSASDRTRLEQEAAQCLALYREHWGIAVENFKKSIEISPSMVTSMYKLASLLTVGENYDFKPGNYDAALEQYQKIQKYWPSYSQTPYNLALVYMNMGNIDMGLHYLKQATDQSIDLDANSQYIRLLMQSSAEKSGSKETDASAKIVNAERRAEAMRVVTRLFNKWDETLGYKSTGARNGITSGSSVHYELTRAVRMENDEKEKKLTQVAEIYTTVARTLGDREASLRGLMRLHQLSPGDENVIYEINRLYREKGDFNDLEDFLKGIVDENPLSLHGRLWLGEAYLDSGKLREAKRQALALQRMDSKDSDAQYLFFKIYRAAGNTAKARQMGEEFVKTGGKPEQVKDVKKYLYPNSDDATTMPLESTSSPTSPSAPALSIEAK